MSDMIHDILKILDTTDLQELDKQRITNDLLRLFNVVGRSELLLAFFEHIQRECNIEEDITFSEVFESFKSE